MLGHEERWLMLAPSYKQYGMSLIEVLVAFAIVAILSTFGYGTFANWVQNQQIRTAAEAILNGMQITRAEAVKRNNTARMVLCNVPNSSWEVLASSAAAPQPAASPACTGSTAAAGEERVQDRSTQEGSRNAVVTVTPAGATTITFNGLGRVANNADGSAAITQVDVSNARGTRPLRITITTGGSVRMCDPSLDPVSGDPRRC